MEFVVDDLSTYPELGRLITISFIHENKTQETCIYDGENFTGKHTTFNPHEIQSWDYRGGTLPPPPGINVN